MQYRGLGDYQNFNVPVSDVGLFNGLLDMYLKLNNVYIVDPRDPTADAVLYVSVDVFGLNRSRFDTYVYNRERVIAETAVEMMAFDKKTGRMIMTPRNANYEAKYDENFVLWAGPFISNKSVREGEGLLVDFSGVDGTKKTYPIPDKNMNYYPITDERQKDVDERMQQAQQQNQNGSMSIMINQKDGSYSKLQNSNKTNNNDNIVITIPKSLLKQE